MFEESPFRHSSIASQPSPSKELPKRSKSPPRSCEEWLASKGQQNVLTSGRGAASNARGSWPERAPEGEQLLGDNLPGDEGGLILGTLEDIKRDIQTHARETNYLCYC